MSSIFGGMELLFRMLRESLMDRPSNDPTTALIMASDDTSGKTSNAEPATDWRRLREMTDEQVHAAITDDPDIVPTDDAFWAKARVVRPRPKESVTIDLDADLLEWFRGKRGFQARINAILRAYMDAQNRSER